MGVVLPVFTRPDIRTSSISRKEVRGGPVLQDILYGHLRVWVSSAVAAVVKRLTCRVLEEYDCEPMNTISPNDDLGVRH